ncbi:hypothetical protein PIB30_051986 [Stylosanthes scabra]|uniref:Cytochrome P450 n=1 Tax=Stylosanthes scabra TaxID=79078 RepID=A0ABU6SIX3_9FABA|nr:hypothetical protein [Stylosanthes scabra]
MMYSLECFSLFLAIFSFFSIHIWRINRNLPIPNLPFLGMIPAILFNVSNIHEYLTTALKHYGGTFKVRGPLFTNLNFFLTSDPMNVHHVTSKNFVNYGKGSEFHEIFEILGDGIFNSDSHKWKYQRNLLQSLFKQNIFENFVRKVTHKKLQGYLLPLLNEVSESRTTVDLQDIFQRFTFDSICSIVLAFDPNCLPNKLTQFPEVAIEKAFNKMEDTIFYRHLVPRWFWKLQRWLQIGHEKDSITSLQIADKFLYDCISSSLEMKSRFNNTKDDESNFDMLKALVEKSGMEQVDHKFLRDTANNLLAAGRDTISSTLCWFFWLVSTHPNVETKILEEIRLKFKTNEENWLISGVEDLDKLIYLHGAICEALRLFPPVPSYKFMAFNAGPRSCLGKNISFIQLKMIVIALLWNFHFQVVEGHSVCPSVSIILHMKHGLQVKITKRGN